MSAYQPPFVISPGILSQVVEIGELMGHWASMAGRASPLLRKENRIRTIQASLAIEHNSLTAGQVTALMEGKRVLAQCSTTSSNLFTPLPMVTDGWGACGRR